MAKAVLFDLWNTLLYCPTKDSVSEMLGILGLEGKVTYAMFISEMDRTVFIDPEYALERMCAEVCARHGAHPGEKAVGEAVSKWDERLRGAKLFPDAEAALEGLGDYKLALVSNTDAGGAKYVKDNGLDRFFDAVVMSCYVGCAKPDPAIYRLALEELGVEARDAWMVGDSLDCDAHGAANAGLNAVLLDRGGVHSGHGHETIKGLAELAEVIA
jgi:putative hydrolase of the HAD superfamily